MCLQVRGGLHLRLSREPSNPKLRGTGGIGLCKHAPPTDRACDSGVSQEVKHPNMGVRIRGTLGDIDRLNKVPFKRATSRVQKGHLQGVSLILPRKIGPRNLLFKNQTTR